jgi:hypothetical protein
MGGVPPSSVAEIGFLQMEPSREALRKPLPYRPIQIEIIVALAIIRKIGRVAKFIDKAPWGAKLSEESDSVHNLTDWKK